MAKKAWFERNKRKQETVKKYEAIRKELKAKRDYAGLAKLPRNASPSRVVNRCSMSGRRHGYLTVGPERASIPAGETVTVRRFLGGGRAL